MDDDSLRQDRCVSQRGFGLSWFRISMITLGLMVLTGVIYTRHRNIAETSPLYASTRPSSIERDPLPVDSTVARKDALASAKLRVLCVGNSHTGLHNLPELVMNLLNHHFGPGYAFSNYFPVSSLDDNDDALMREIESGNWNTVILQAQKTSSSGKYYYPTDTGIVIAKHAIKHNCKTFFFSEWGIQNVADHSNFTESIYQSMADESGGQLIPVGRAWEAVLDSQPTIALYSADRNHQSRLGASLTALVIASYLSNEPADKFAQYTDPVATASQWSLFIHKVSQIQLGRKKQS